MTSCRGRYQNPEFLQCSKQNISLKSKITRHEKGAEKTVIKWREEKSSQMRLSYWVKQVRHRKTNIVCYCLYVEEKERQIPYAIAYMWKEKETNSFIKQKQSHRCRKQTGYQGIRAREINWGVGTDINTLPYANWGLPRRRQWRRICLPMQETRDLGLIPGSGRSPRGGRGNTLQYSCLGNPMDRGAWWATVHGVTESDTTEAT